jgi:hypothetical protein
MLAVVAFAVVYADHSSTGRAFVFLGLSAQELVDAIVSYELEVFDHAHAVFCSIPLIERLQPLAGEVWAFIAESHFIIDKQLAVLFYESTSLVARQAAGAVDYLSPFFIHIVCISKVAAAYAAVHAAWCD